MEIKGIELSGTIYDIEDETARTNASEASENASEAKTSVETLLETVSNMQDLMNNLASQGDQIEQKIGDLDSPLDTTAQTLIGAVNELNSAVGGSRTQKTVSFQSGFSNTTGNRVDYVPGVKALVFYVGGSISSAITENLTAFTLSISEEFSIGGYGYYVPIVLRNSASGATTIGSVILTRSGNTITAKIGTVPSGTWTEFRMLGNVLFSL